MTTKQNDKKSKGSFAKLTWDDVNNWASNTIIERGRNYKQNGHVRDLTITSNGALLAWVHGTGRYATTVEISNGKLESLCTCPYGAPCKHAVAVILQYLDQLKNKQPLPKAEPNDERLQRLFEHLD
ncbi:MAG: SWIM zinc finger family protein [Acidobacteriota bacterium]